MLHGNGSNDPKAVTSYIRSLATKKSAEITSILLELRAADVQLNVFHCSAAIKVFHSHGWPTALGFLSTMQTWAVAPDDVATAAALTGGFSWALAINIVGRRRTVNPVLSLCSERWPLASSLLQQAPSLRSNLDVISYNSACNSFAKNGIWLRSITLLRSMAGQSIQSDGITFNAAINTCGNAWVKALNFFQEMEGRHLQINEMSCGAAMKLCTAKWRMAGHFLQSVRKRAMKMNVVHGHSILTACGTCSQWAQTLEQVRRLQAHGSVDCKALVAGIHGVSKVKRWSVPLALFQIHQKTCGNQAKDCVSWNAALAASGEGNAWGAVLELLKTLGSKGLVPDEVSWGTTVSSFEQGARWQHALHFVKVAGCMASDICRNSAVSSCEKAGHWLNALSLVHCMQQHAGRPGSIGFNAVLTACESSAWPWSLQLLGQLQNQQLATEVSYSEAAIAAAQASSWPLSLVLLGDDGGAAWATSMGAAVEACGPRQRLQLLAKLGSSSALSLSHFSGAS